MIFAAENSIGAGQLAGVENNPLDRSGEGQKGPLLLE
jgi:hypothetical protein